VLPTSTADVLPAAVPRLAPEERVFIEDPSTPAPGADAVRWFFYAASPPWSATRHSLSNVRALQKEFAVKLRNVYSFFTIYANIDGFRPSETRPAVDRANEPELDRWIRSELALTTRQVTECMDEYDVYAATQRLIALVDALSNWWVRRSRARFWRSGWDDDKRGAYETLYECLVSISKLTAPFTPYAAEAMYQNLVRRTGAGRESVHLEDWPEPDLASVDDQLSKKIEAVRALVSLGLQVRTQARIKVRQPLRAARIITATPDLIDRSASTQLMQELNVEREVETYGVENAEQYVEFRVKPSFRSLGKRGLGKEAQALKKAMGAMSSKDAGALASRLMAGGTVTMDGVELAREDIEVEFVAKEGFAAAGDRAGVVVLDTRMDDGLRDRGLVRELQYRIQALRKELALEYTDRIRVALLGGERIRRVVEEYRDALAGEVLAVDVSTTQTTAGMQVRDLDVEGETVRVGIVKA
jgi:isoleucyl-tRNA synthetase